MRAAVIAPAHHLDLDASRLDAAAICLGAEHVWPTAARDSEFAQRGRFGKFPERARDTRG